MVRGIVKLTFYDFHQPYLAGRASISPINSVVKTRRSPKWLLVLLFVEIFVDEVLKIYLLVLLNLLHLHMNVPVLNQVSGRAHRKDVVGVHKVKKGTKNVYIRYDINIQNSDYTQIW